MEQETLFWNCRLSRNWMMKIKSGKIWSNDTLSSNWDVFVCVFVFIWISHSWEFLFWNSKRRNFKIIFPVHILWYITLVKTIWQIENTYLPPPPPPPLSLKSSFNFGSKMRQLWRPCLLDLELLSDRSLPQSRNRKFRTQNLYNVSFTWKNTYFKWIFSYTI